VEGSISDGGAPGGGPPIPPRVGWHKSGLALQRRGMSKAFGVSVGVGVKGSFSDGGAPGGGPPIKPFGVNVGASAKGPGEVSGVGVC
jgi:hypothetical protein